MVNHHADRPGHDLRYGLSGAKMAKMGWVPPYGFEASLTKSIKWTLQNRHWLELKRWAEDPNIYEGIAPEDIGKVFDPTISTSNTKKELALKKKKNEWLSKL